MSHFDPQSFWDGKILKWEAGRYGPDNCDYGFFNRMVDKASDSLRFRLKTAAEILAPHVAGQRVLELGCGSGLLSRLLLKDHDFEYMGVDFAKPAIDKASEAAGELDYADRVRYAVGDVATAVDFQPDITVSLGLIDWLTLKQIEGLMGNSPGHFLHSIPEKRPSLSRLVHQAYVFVAYGYGSKGYRPSYYRIDEITGIAKRHNSRPVNVFRNRRLSFGAILTTLPLPGQ